MQLLLLNADLNKCLVGTFNKWIGRYSDPPTYPRRFDKMDFTE